MKKLKSNSMLLNGFACRLDAIRQEAIAMITNAVAEHKIIGTFYKNLGDHYRPDEETWEYGSAPAVVTHNDSFGTYGGYEAATVYELFFDERGRLLCTLNGEAGEDFDEPIEHIQTEGLLNIVEWLVEHGFVADDPWRCEACGSLAVQANIWIDANTHEVTTPAHNRSEHYCSDCDANVYHIRQSELLRNIDRWWHEQDFRQLEHFTRFRQDDFDPEDGYQAFVDACNTWWNALSNNMKICLWNKNQ